MTSNTDGAAQGEAVWEIHCNKCKTGKFTSWRSWHDNHGPYWMCTECDNYVFAAGLVPLLGAALIDDHRKAQTADVLVKALEDMAVESNRGKLRPALWYMGHARAALAQFHAATEEATHG